MVKKEKQITQVTAKMVLEELQKVKKFELSQQVTRDLENLFLSSLANSAFFYHIMSENKLSEFEILANIAVIVAPALELSNNFRSADVELENKLSLAKVLSAFYLLPNEITVKVEKIRGLKEYSLANYRKHLAEVAQRKHTYSTKRIKKKN